MHQPLSDESLLLPTTNSLLNPTLKRALGVMDARLEDELARYRRYRRGMKVSPSAIQVMQRSGKTKAKASAPQLATMPKPTPTVVPQPPTVTPPAVAAVASTSAAATMAAAVTPPPPPLTPVSIQHDPEAVSSLAIRQDDELTTGQGVTVGQENYPSTNQLSRYGLYAAADDGLADGFMSDRAPTDYMESSEELLRSLAAEEASAAVERNVLEGLLTPFGVGAMMLMLLGSGMFGYLIMNPASLTALKQFADRIASFRARPTNLASSSGDILSSSATDMGWLSNAPALDSDEFLSLNLNNFSALRTRPGGDGLMPTPLSLVTKNNGGKPARLLPNQKGKPGGIGTVLKNFTPLTIKPLTPPAPTIGGDNGGFAAPIRVAKSYEGGGGSYNPPAPQIQAPAPTYYEPPRRPARTYQPPAPTYQEPSYSAPARSYDPPAAKPYVPPAVPVVELPPAPAETPQPQGDFRVVTPYTNDADLEAAQKTDPTASFRNLDDGAFIQRGGSYSSREEADAAATKLKEQGVEAEVK
jgi:hypothetical protein